MFILLFTILLNASPTESRDTINISKSARPEKDLYVKTQYAGNMGLISAGAGSYFFNDRISIDINYGLLPKYINGVSVHSFSIKPAYNFKEYHYGLFSAACYTGINMVYSVGRNIYPKTPDQYPRNYYPQNALHFNPFFGLKQGMDINARKISRLYLYAELGTVDYKIWYALKNKEIAVYDIPDLCFGILLQLR